MFFRGIALVKSLQGSFFILKTKNKTTLSPVQRAGKTTKDTTKPREQINDCAQETDYRASTVNSEAKGYNGLHSGVFKRMF